MPSLVAEPAVANTPDDPAKEPQYDDDLSTHIDRDGALDRRCGVGDRA